MTSTLSEPDASSRVACSWTWAQVVQESRDRLRLRLVPARPLTEADRQALVRRVRDHVGAMEVDIDEVERIERDAAGKFRAVVSRLGEDERG